MASHQQDGADAPLALLMVWIVVAPRMTRLKMAGITPLAMLVIEMILTRTCGSKAWRSEKHATGEPCADIWAFGSVVEPSQTRPGSFGGHSQRPLILILDAGAVPATLRGNICFF